MGEIGTIVGFEGEYALVNIERKSACDKCGACFRGGIGGGDKMTARAVNKCGAQEGDFVEIELLDGLLFKSVIIMYGSPLLGFFAGITAGFFLSKLFRLEQYIEIISFFCGLALILVTYLLIMKFEKKIKKSKYTPVVTRVIS